MPTVHLTPNQIRWQRFQRAGLRKPFADAPTAATALVGIQAQILPAAGLALWNRTPALSHNHFDELIFHQRSLVKLWGQRGTLHLYASNDWSLLHAARTTDRTWTERQAERGDPGSIEHRKLVEQVAELLRSKESLGRRELRASGIPLSDELLSPWGGIFSDLVRLGYACHSGRAAGEGHFVARERWLPNLLWEPPDPTLANVTIVERYLAAYGPATLQDFAYWRGVPASKARDWFNQLMPKLTEVEVEGQVGFLLSAAPTDSVEGSTEGSLIDEIQAAPPPPEAWPVRMLYRFDPYLLAHRSKDWVVPPSHYKAVWRPAGHIEGIVLSHGQAVATWRYDRKSGGLAIQVNPFKHLPKYVTKQIEKQSPKIAEFFHLPLVDLTIKTPE